MQKFLIVIAGPTASGKTSLGIQLAQKYGTVILSADSRQFYKEMSIGTAKPNTEELAAAKHLFIDNLSIQEEYTVGQYEKDAIDILNELFKTKDVVLLVGGSGLFIKAVLEGLDQFPEVPQPTRNKWTKLYEDKGIEELQTLLEKQDPEYFKEVDIQNPHRLIRALSVVDVSGKPFSSFRNKSGKKRDFMPISIKLNWDREALYNRINLRVDQMMEQGLLEEAKTLFPLKDLNALQTVGYQEFFDFFEGKISKEEAIELLKRNTRRYAKRQMTWLRKMENNSKFFHPSDYKDIENYIEEKMKHS